MKRYILTGAPGCGKTTIIRALLALGHYTVDEAATDVIAGELSRGVTEPWRMPTFIDRITELQRERQLQIPATPMPVQFFDRSPICTHALSTFLGYPISPELEAEMKRIGRDSVYEHQVFFIENLGFVERTEARRIDFESSLAFERVHLDSYRRFGYHLIHVPAAPVNERVENILRHVEENK